MEPPVAPLDLAECPRDQQEITGSPLHGARARKERLRERVADRADTETKLVTCLRLSEELYDLQRSPAFSIREVEP